MSMFCPDTSYDQFSGTFNNAQIFFCHTKRSSLSTVFQDNYDGNSPSQVLSRASLPLNWTETQWNQIDFDGTFDYNGTDNLLIEIRWNGASGGLITGVQSPASGRELLGAAISDATGTLQTYRNVLRLHSPSSPCIAVLSSSTADADLDGYLEPDESAWITCKLGNGGGSTATNLQVTLSTSSPWCTVVSNAWSAGDVPSGAIRSNSAAPFMIQIQNNAPLGAPLPFNLSVSANGGSYTKVCSFALETAKPVISLAGWFLNDSTGNTNCFPDAGERVLLLLHLTNSGYRAENVRASLSCGNGFISLIASNSALGTIEHGSDPYNTSSPFCFDVSASARAGSIYTFNTDISYDHCYATSRLSVTSGGYKTGTVACSWIDTTGGTTLPVSDEGYTLVDMGFSVPFYGAAPTNKITVVGNGFLSLGTVSGMTYDNQTIPTAATPNSIIAPFWDDMDPDSGGVVRCAGFGSAPNRYWVVEWNSVPRYSDGGSFTFEAILYESGVIRFQYGAMSGTASDGSSASIGIENSDGTVGIQYAFNRAGAVYDGLAIEFDPRPPMKDDDADGLPNEFETFYFGNSGGQTGIQDSDNDGRSNVDEMRCGTDPMEKSSVLKVETAQTMTSTNAFVITWQSVPGRQYNVKSCSNLCADTWSNLNAMPLQASGTGFNTYTASVGTASQNCCFRVAVP